MERRHAILIVEDERIVAEDLKEVLQHLGYDVPAIIISGEQAIEKSGELHPDLVLMDIFLAGEMNGITAAQAIRDQFGIPVIYLTAYADKEIMAKAKVTEPYGYILKPYDERELHSTIEIALYKHDLDIKLRESEERYRGFVENFQGIAFRRDLDFSPVFLHGAVEEITGYHEDDFTRHDLRWLDIVRPEDHARIRETCHSLQETPGLKMAREYGILRKDNTARWVCEHIQHVRGNLEHPPYIQGTLHDVTDRVLAVEGIKKRDAVLLAVGLAVEWFFRAPLLEPGFSSRPNGNTNGDVAPLLEQVGNAVNVDQIAIYQHHVDEKGTPFISLRYEWASPGSPSYIHNPRFNKLLYRKEGLTFWEETLGQGKYIAGNIGEFGPEEREFLSHLGYTSFLVLPVIRKDTFWGFLMLSCKAPRSWPSEEVEGIRIVANIVAMVIGYRDYVPLCDNPESHV
ncbi:MAG: response regulator [Methanoregulaceae archaeon]